MYKTAENTPVNGVITHQKQQISKKWYCSAVHWYLGNMLRNIILYYKRFNCKRQLLKQKESQHDKTRLEKTENDYSVISTKCERANRNLAKT